MAWTQIKKTSIYFSQLSGDPQRYGLHLSTCQVEDTFEEYLQKMQKSTKWDNHPILQALADVFSLEINVFYFVDSHNKHSIITLQTNATGVKFHIYLGCNEEAHYFSLRPLQWMTELPYSKTSFSLLFLLFLDINKLNYCTTFFKFTNIVLSSSYSNIFFRLCISSGM